MSELLCLTLKENGKLSLEIPLSSFYIDGVGIIDDADQLKIAMEKATPQAPRSFTRSFKGIAAVGYNASVHYYCPKCDFLVGLDLRPIGIIKFDRNLYCPDCGQKIDWSEYNE